MSYFTDKVNDGHLGMFSGRSEVVRGPAIQSGTVYGLYNQQDQTFDQPLNQLTAWGKPPQPVYNLSAARRTNMNYAKNSRYNY